MILQPIHPWLPQEMVLGGLPWVAELIRLVHDALCTAAKLDAILSNQFPTTHQPAIGWQFWKMPHRLYARNDLAIIQLARMQTFAIILASKHSAHCVVAL